MILPLNFNYHNTLLNNCTAYTFDFVLVYNIIVCMPTDIFSENHFLVTLQKKVIKNSRFLDNNNLSYIILNII